MGDPADMRSAMAAYVHALHQAYLDASVLLPPAERARLPLVALPDFTVAAVGARVLHVIATAERLPEPQGPEIEMQGSLPPLEWSLRFFDPVVIPGLGLVDETQGPGYAEVRDLLGIRTVLYHLAVPPGATLTAHHASHAGTGLAHSHAAAARDFEAIRAHASGREEWVDELQGAWLAGLGRAQVLLAQAIDPGLTDLSLEPPTDPAVIRGRLLERLRGRSGPARSTR